MPPAPHERLENRQELTPEQHEAARAAVKIHAETEGGVRGYLFGQETRDANGFFVEAGVLGNCQIVTNNHALPDAVSKIQVQTASGERYSASVRGRDPANDIAWLQLNNVADPSTACPNARLDTSQLQPLQEVRALALRANEEHLALAGNYLGTYSRSLQRSLPVQTGEDVGRMLDLYSMQSQRGDSGTQIAAANGGVVSMLDATGDNVTAGIPARTIVESMKRMSLRRVATE
jgi:S1-C subfamily serine protease